LEIEKKEVLLVKFSRALEYQDVKEVEKLLKNKKFFQNKCKETNLLMKKL